MAGKYIYLSAILLTIVLGAVLDKHYCCDNASAQSDKIAVSATNGLPANTVSVDSFKIRKQEADANKPLPEALILYFGFNLTDLRLTNENIQRMKAIKDYLNEYPASGVVVTGHSDNLGDRTYNISLGLQRAGFIKSYLVQNGFPEDRIRTLSKGPDEPASDNSTAEGRAMNRRTVIIVK